MERAFVLLTPILQEETFGNVVLEAKSVGLPVVAFADRRPPGAHRSTSAHGYLCSSQDADALKRGVEFFLDDDEAMAACTGSPAWPTSPSTRATRATRSPTGGSESSAARSRSTLGLAANKAPVAKGGDSASCRRTARGEVGSDERGGGDREAGQKGRRRSASGRARPYSFPCSSPRS